MITDKNLAIIHSYLCGDGYVIKNPKTQKHKYYRIGFRNTNLILLKDFQKRFERVFKIRPRLVEGERSEIGSREIYEKLTKQFGSFYSRDWKVPELKKRLSNFWLRTFFDCEGWVFCKSRQNRHIGLDSINEKGLDQIIIELNKLGIKTIKKENKKRGIFRIFIYGQENLRIFQDKIGFLHPNKKEKLKEVLNDFVQYEWVFPENEKECKKFIKDKLKEKIRIRKPYYIRIISKEEKNLEKLKDYIKKFYNAESKVYKRKSGIGTIYYELNINKKEEIKRLIKLKIIDNIL
jgi:hypothetical protein